MDTNHNEPLVDVEFLVEPFVEGTPGPHVAAALDAVTAAGLTLDVGPFGTVAQGPLSQVTAAVEALLRASVVAGATRVQLQLRCDQDRPVP